MKLEGKTFATFVENGPTSYVDEHFLMENDHLEARLWQIIDDLYTSPSRGPSQPGKGIALCADSVRGNPPTINVERRSYVRQNFGMDVLPTHNHLTTMRATYGTGSGIRTHGTPLW